MLVGSKSGRTVSDNAAIKQIHRNSNLPYSFLCLLVFFAHPFFFVLRSFCHFRPNLELRQRGRGEGEKADLKRTKTIGHRHERAETVRGELLLFDKEEVR